MVSRGKIKKIGKLIAIKSLMKYSQEEIIKKVTQDTIDNIRAIDNELEPIRNELDRYIKENTKGFNDSDFKALHSKARHYSTVLNNHLGYLGAGLSIVDIINKNRDIRAWDLDIIALYLLDKIIGDNFGISSSELLRVARYISSLYDLDNNSKFKDRIAHIGRANTILMYM